LDEDKKNDSCNLATSGGPAWPLLLAGLLVAIAALSLRRKTD
jgi:MYXO-CTERM domain-containing protein